MSKYCIKEGQESIYKILKNNADSNPRGETINLYSFEGEKRIVTSFNRKEILDKGLATAKLIKDNGAYKDDKIMIFSTNTYDNVLSVIGSMLLGTTFTMIPAPIDDSKIDRFVSVVNSLEPKLILSTEDLISKVKPVINNLIKHGISVELLRNLKFVNVNKAKYDKDFIPEEIELDHIAAIQYSSGSTSEPKGVMISDGNIISMVNSSDRTYNCNSYAGWLPFYHIMGMYLGLFHPVIENDYITHVMAPEDFISKPYRWFELISDTKAEATGGPNSVFKSLSQILPICRVKDLDLSSMKKIISGSEPISYESVESFCKEYSPIGLTKDKFATGYGLTETIAGASVTTKKGEIQPNESRISVLNLDSKEYIKGKIVIVNKDEENSIELVSVGDVLNNNTVKIVNPDTLKECNKDEVGEIWISGPVVAEGYYKNEEATKYSFKCKLPGYDGYFFRTGDLGFLYDNELYVTGRLKELIIINGKNILPNDIIMKIRDNVREVNKSLFTVFSIFEHNKEQMVVLTGVKADDNLDYEKIKDDINECILRYFKFTPYKIRFVSENCIPKTDNGKIATLKAKKLYEEDEFEFLDNSENDEDIDEVTTEIEEKILKLIKENYNYNIRKSSNLLNRGMNSIDVVKLSNILENAFKVEVPVKFIFSNPSVDNIGKYIDKSLCGEKMDLIDNDKSYLSRDAVLPSSIRIKEYESFGLALKNIFLTGSTGFLGAYLIKELIEEKVNKIYCHVRCKNSQDGLNRIIDNMKYYKLWKEEFKEYIVPVPGSLEKNFLGIDKDLYYYLCDNIDVIYHNGAVLNFIYPYENLKGTNVMGTLRTLDIACTGKMKYYNYISSYSVYDNPSHLGRVCLEDDPLEDNTGYALAYSETKWVCEKIINVAKERGLKAAIYRPGDITGSVSTGIWKYSDMVSRIFKSIIKYGVYPDWDKKFYMTTVDYVAEAIVEISKKEDSYGKTYNVINKKGVTMNEMAELIKECGYNLKEVDYSDWIMDLANSDMSHPLKPLESLLKGKDRKFSDRYGSGSGVFDTSNAENALEGSGIRCYDINADIIRKYIKNFR